jgi:iron complex transport system ATP-binding protein
MMTAGVNGLLATEELAVGYRSGGKLRRRVVEGINVSLAAGELVCLLGPNGAGKSTLLRTLAGLHPPLEGRVLLHGEDLHRLGRRRARLIGVVLTEPVQVGMMSVYALVSLGRYPHTDWLGRLGGEDHRVIRWALSTASAVTLMARHVNELSDGERQKVMIARALAQEPELMILDEPTAFLDLPRRIEIVAILRRLARETGRAVLMATHNLDLAMRSADRIWLLPLGGPAHAGAPEDLVLDGSLERTFVGSGTRFDVASGTFRTLVETWQRIGLEGEGLAGLWTARALEREGFAVEREGVPSDPRVEVRGEGEECRWWTVVGDERREHRTIYDLCRSLREQIEAGPVDPISRDPDPSGDGDSRGD